MQTLVWIFVNVYYTSMKTCSMQAVALGTVVAGSYEHCLYLSLSLEPLQQ